MENILDRIKVGTKFTNSAGNITTIKRIRFNILDLISETGTKWTVGKEEFVDRVRNSKYSFFENLKQENITDQLQVGTIFKCGKSDTPKVILEISDDYILFEKYSGKMSTFGTDVFNKYYSDNFIHSLKNLKKGDENEITFIPFKENYKVKNDHPDLYDKLVELGYLKFSNQNNKKSKFFYLYKDTWIKIGDSLDFFNSNSHLEIKSQQILNYKKTNKNEKTREITTDTSRERTSSAISSSSSRQTATSSRYIGNSTSGRAKKTRIGRFEISKRAISI